MKPWFEELKNFNAKRVWLQNQGFPERADTDAQLFEISIYGREVDLLQTDDLGRNALHYAIQELNPDLVKAFLNSTQDFQLDKAFALPKILNSFCAEKIIVAAAEEKTPDGKPKETPDKTPQEVPEKTPKETPKETPQETPPDSPQETPVTEPQETPPAAPQELPGQAPDDGALHAEEHSQHSDSGIEMDLDIFLQPATPSEESEEEKELEIKSAAVLEEQMGYLEFLLIVIGNKVINVFLDDKKINEKGIIQKSERILDLLLCHHLKTDIPYTASFQEAFQALLKTLQHRDAAKEANQKKFAIQEGVTGMTHAKGLWNKAKLQIQKHPMTSKINFVRTVRESQYRKLLSIDLYLQTIYELKPKLNSAIQEIEDERLKLLQSPKFFSKNPLVIDVVVADTRAEERKTVRFWAG